MYICIYECPDRPEAGAGSPVARLTDSCGPSGKISSTLSHWTASSARDFVFSSRKNRDREIDKIGRGEVWGDAQLLQRARVWFPLPTWWFTSI